MARKPKELKQHKKQVHVDDGNDYAIPNISITKCVVCGLDGKIAKESKTELIYSPIDKDNYDLVCECCFDDFCEVCRKMKTNLITHRNYRIKEHKFSQICTECYIEKCNEIIELDKNYDK